MRNIKSVYPNLLAELTRNGYSYHAFAKVLGISVPSLSNKMNGKTDFTLREAMEIMDLFNLKIRYLFEKRK